MPDAIINIKDFISQLKNNFNENIKNKKKYFISAGRLTKQKNFSYLIDEFYEFSRKNSEIDLLIFGEGEEKNNLIRLIKKKNLLKRVFLMGHTSQIYLYMKIFLIVQNL